MLVTPYEWEAAGERRIDHRATYRVQMHLPTTLTHRFDQCGRRCSRLLATKCCEAVLNRSDLRVAGDDTLPVFPVRRGTPDRVYRKKILESPHARKLGRRDHQ